MMFHPSSGREGERVLSQEERALFRASGAGAPNTVPHMPVPAGMNHIISGRLGETVATPPVQPTRPPMADPNPRFCDGCQSNLSLRRFRCLCCPDFDLCETCAPLHPQSHPLVFIRSPWHQHWDRVFDMTTLVNKDGQPCDFSAPPDHHILKDLRNRIDQILFNEQEAMTNFVDAHRERTQRTQGLAQGSAQPLPQTDSTAAAALANPPPVAPHRVSSTISTPSIFPTPLFTPPTFDPTASHTFPRASPNPASQPPRQPLPPPPAMLHLTSGRAGQTTMPPPPSFGMGHFSSGRTGQDVLQRNTPPK
uniref:ZZ-type domain-containing protein n=1 Tax=Chromera velia CCMP2878 TaxID=1169474 RepID=A0A0G4H6W9_9ALVE|eukprot:Cvel_24937.t1-p1 / transcript=Cvel_24937.t1 / gene=Cvel_24937 / organism=Chromera_velia_CCMP2878 / gene_product=hypothetical protein / transcript_product=hypothetical protein / location=Cvel_scaffold2759:13467-14384(+) / protein_length=306 / sequence_SO=supercontig / SO=protein_coding / is_pseudo=false